MVAFSKIKAGDVLYDCRMVKQGNADSHEDGLLDCKDHRG